MIFRVVRAFSRLMARSLAPARSLTWAPVTTTDSSQPSASTAACRPLPLILPAVEPAAVLADGIGGLDDLGVDDEGRRLAPPAPMDEEPAAPPGAQGLGE